jgi:hypothetical protein
VDKSSFLHWHWDVLSEFQKKRYSTPKHYYQTAKQYRFGNLFGHKNTIGFDTPNTATISFGNIVFYLQYKFTAV